MIEKELKDIVSFPGVIGAIDGSHILIKAPVDMQADYVKRKHSHSVNLIAACNSRKKFTSLDVGFPGYAHGNCVFSTSDLYIDIERNRPAYFPSPSYHKIGDSAFAFKPFILVPYKDTGRLTREQVRCNNNLYKTRSLIENTFALLKGSFKRLKFVDAKI